MLLKSQLQSLVTCLMSMFEYIEKKRLSDDDMVSCLLQGLDTSYGSLKTVVHVRSEDVSSDELLGLLLHEEDRIDAKQTVVLRFWHLLQCLHKSLLPTTPLTLGDVDEGKAIGVVDAIPMVVLLLGHLPIKAHIMGSLLSLVMQLLKVTRCAKFAIV